MRNLSAILGLFTCVYCSTPVIKEQFAFVGERAVLINTQDTGISMKWYSVYFAPHYIEDVSHKVVTYTKDNGAQIKAGFAFDPLTGDLIIPKVNLKHDSNYTLTVGDLLRKSWSFNNLNVYVPQSDVRITHDPPEETAGVNVTTQCVVTRVKPANVTFHWSLTGYNRNRNPADVRHFRDEIPHVESTFTNRDGTFRVKSQVTLRFSHLDHLKLLRCDVVHGVDTSIKVHVSKQIVVNYAPIGHPAIYPGHLAVKVGTPCSLSCDTDSLIAPGNPPVTSRIWFRNGKVLPNTEAVIEVSHDRISDGATYRCRVKNIIGHSELSPELTITVDAPMRLENEAGNDQTVTHRPRFDDGTFHVTFQMFGGRDVHLLLLKSGRSVPSSDFAVTKRVLVGDFGNGLKTATRVTLNWQIAAREMNACENIGYFNGNYSFTMTGTEGSESGNKTLFFSIDVQYPALWRNDIGVREVVESANENATLLCSVCANPQPIRYTWSFEGGFLPDGVEPEVEQLHIVGLNNSVHLGMYSCTVINVFHNGVLHRKKFDIKLSQPETLGLSMLWIVFVIVVCLSVLVMCAAVVLLFRKLMSRKRLRGSSNPLNIKYKKEDYGNTWRFLPRKANKAPEEGGCSKARPLSTLSTLSTPVIGAPVLTHPEPGPHDYDDVAIPLPGESPKKIHVAPLPEPVYNIYEPFTQPPASSPLEEYDYACHPRRAMAMKKAQDEQLEVPADSNTNSTYEQMNQPASMSPKENQEAFNPSATPENDSITRDRGSKIGASRKFKPADRSDLAGVPRKI